MSTRRPLDREAGASTVLVAGVLGAMLVALVLALALAQVQVARQDAQGAADLGSLAAAGALQRDASPAQACAAAERVVRANGARTGSCAVEGEEVVVRATVEVGLGALGTHEAAASARAGPTG